MTKKDCIKVIAKKHEDFTQTEVEMIVDDFLSEITNALVSGEKFQIVGFGSFDVTDRPARPGRNPKTGKEVMIPASKAPKFKAGKDLKEAVNV